MIEQKDPRFRNLEVKIGVMVAIAVAGIVAVIALIGIERDIFTKKFTVYFVADNGAGFVKGMPVKLSGFKIGRLKSTALTGDARVKVTVEINSKYRKWIREGSRARLVKEGFIGDSLVEITLGDLKGRVLSEADMIPYEKTGGIDELITEAKPILNEVREIIHYANSPDGDIKQILGNIKELTLELRETRRSMDAAVTQAGAVIKKTDALVENIDAKSAPAMESAARAMKNLDGLTSRLEPVMTRIETITEKAEAAATRLPAASEKLEKAADNVKGMTDTLAAETPRIRSIIIDADEALRDGKTIIKGAKKTWPVRLMVPAAKSPELVPLDGYMIKRSGDGRP